MKKRFALAALLAAAPFAVPAQELSYSYIEGGYNNLEFTQDSEADGPYVRGSLGIGENFHIFGGYTRLSGESLWASLSGGHRDETDYDKADLGLGYHHGLSERLDAIAELSFVHQSIETTRHTRPFAFVGPAPQPYSVRYPSESSNSTKLVGGLRGLVTDHFEAWAKGGYFGGGDIDGGVTATLGGQWTFGQTWGVVGELEFADDTNEYRLGVRASF